MTERKEYRVVADRGPTLYYREGDLARARKQMAYGRELERPGVRIQVRMVATTPWVDLPESKQGVDRG